MTSEIWIESKSAEEGLGLYAKGYRKINEFENFQYVPIASVLSLCDISIIRIHGSLSDKAVQNISLLTAALSPIESIGSDSRTIERVLTLSKCFHVTFRECVLPSHLKTYAISSLDIDRCMFGDIALEGVRFDTLTLSTECSGSILRSLNTKALKRLFIHGGSICGEPDPLSEGLSDAVSRLTGVKEVYLSMVRIDTNGLLKLLACGAQSLTITGDVTNVHLRHPSSGAQFPSIKHLDVWTRRSPRVASQVKFLQMFPNVESLSICGSRMTDELLECLREMTSLQNVTYFSRDVSEVDTSQLPPNLTLDILNDFI